MRTTTAARDRRAAKEKSITTKRELGNQGAYVARLINLYTRRANLNHSFPHFKIRRHHTNYRTTVIFCVAWNRSPTTRTK